MLGVDWLNSFVTGEVGLGVLTQGGLLLGVDSRELASFACALPQVTLLRAGDSVLPEVDDSLFACERAAFHLSCPATLVGALPVAFPALFAGEAAAAFFFSKSLMTIARFHGGRDLM